MSDAAVTAEQAIGYARNEGIRNTVAFLRSDEPQRARLILFESFRKQARLAGIGWDYLVNPVTKRL